MLLSTILVLVVSVFGAGNLARAHEDCPHFKLEDMRRSVEDVDIIVIGVMASEGSMRVIQPEVYLRGSAVAGPLGLIDQPSICIPAEPPPDGGRVIVGLRRVEGGFQWPVSHALFVVEDGFARAGGDQGVSLTEEELVSRIREVSGQYAVVATHASQGASINWVGVILPVGLSAIVILSIALVLLRIWHRIEPE
ncbi:MAG: hypothetical protein CL897_03255 [Dehalococcoidia bacterium]|nr:hypothetical protein [Dehalococcoidia bacterium]|tara:strand:- start:1896 stop:2477 length:582 start_codon:yes stop_codon:yes gene_type:complete